MTAKQMSSEIFVYETQRKPNRYAANVLAGIVAVITIVFILNELGVFEVSRELVHICLTVSLSQLIIMRLIIRSPKLIVHNASKYVIIGMVLFLVLTITVLLNIHAILAYVLPILLATQYRSRRISAMALIGSCACCFISPILSYFLDTWNLNFMTGYIQTFCKVTIDITNGNAMGTAFALQQITLYWSMPQALTLGAFGLILFSTTRSGIESVNNQIQVADLSHDLMEHHESIVTMQERMLYTMSDIIENRDVETGGHVKRTSEIVRVLMDAMQNDPSSNVTDVFCNNVIKTAPMHDIGKIAIPDVILRKPSGLTDEEYALIKQHPLKSAAIIEQALTGIENEDLLNTAKNIAKYHHERMDGTGYPQGLKGDEIPLEARIMAIADVYDALVSKRCYKAPIAFDEAFETIESSMGTQFDAALNPYFVACRHKIEKFYEN